MHILKHLNIYICTVFPIYTNGYVQCLLFHTLNAFITLGIRTLLESECAARRRWFQQLQNSPAIASTPPPLLGIEVVFSLCPLQTLL